MQIEMTNSRWGLLSVFVVSLALLIYLSWPSSPKQVDTMAAINEATETIEKQYKGQIAEKERQVTDFKSRLVVSEGKYKLLAQKYQSLQKEKDNVKAPITNQDIRDRLTAAGFTPLPPTL